MQRHQLHQQLYTLASRSLCTNFTMLTASKQTGQASMHSAAPLRQMRGGCRTLRAHLLVLKAGRGRGCCSLCVALRLGRRHRGRLSKPGCVHGTSKPALQLSQSL